jgi:hypothetical protein
LDDLPTPEEVASRAQRRARERGLRGRWRRELEEQLKLQYYFGGQCVSYLRGAGGIVVMAAGRSGSPEYQRQLAGVAAEQRARLVLAIPPRWNDEDSEILTPERHEG